MSANHRSRNLILIGIAALFLFVCIGSFSIAGAVGYFFFLQPVEADSAGVEIRVVEEPVATPTPVQSRRPSGAPAPPPAHAPRAHRAEVVELPSVEYFTEQQLAETIVPTRDLRDLALRLRPEVEAIPLVVNSTQPVYNLGDREQFWVANTATNQNFQITARLIHKTDVAYAWVEVDHDYDARRIGRSVDRFSQEIYPVLRAFFGSEWSPGVDNDPRIHILHAGDLGGGTIGYYSSANEFSRLANAYSNEKELFLIDLGWLNGSQNYTAYETTLAHEFQHMIHWHNDRNEVSWINEGLSELAQEIVGYPPEVSKAAIFASVPDTQLNTWSSPSEGTLQHYGAAYLFMAYLFQRFGNEVTQAVVAHPANDVTGVTLALQESGHALSFDDIFADWLVANLIDDPDALDATGVYGYRQLDAPSLQLDKAYQRYPIETRHTDVRNYGADYIALEGRGDITLHFQGETETRLANVAPSDGDMMWWSNRADDSDSRLTRAFDLTTVAADTPVEMQVSMWYDIETDYDYGYVLASRDGQKWDILPGQSTTTENPSGNSFGHGYTGVSSPQDAAAAWVTEVFDLSAYTGEEILIRFEYVTDDAVNDPGWFIDEISIPAIDYSTSFEEGSEAWESEGWILTDNRLPQHWLLQILALEDGELVDVRRVPVGEDGSATIDVDGLGGDSTAILIVSGLTPVTTEPAVYTYRITQR